MRRQRKRAEDLRRAVDCLPRATRTAMLEGLERSNIIVGAYSDGSGGICPMLAAHRNGGRTSLVSFARAWDRYTEAKSGARRATPRELNTLRAMLEASLYYEADEYELARAAAEHRAAMERGAERLRRRRRDTGERNRAPELRARPGWAWLRVFRRLDEWEAALAHAEKKPRENERELERV
jgi:hypothetical protein